MKQLFFVAAVLSILGAAWAQPSVDVHVVSPPCGKFLVDGLLYEKSAVFNWSLDTVHTLQALESYDISHDIRCTVGTDWSGPGILSNGPVALVQAVSAGQTLTLAAKYTYKVSIVLGPDPLTPWSSAPYFDPLAPFCPVSINGTCYTVNTAIWKDSGGTLTVQVTPPIGWAFTGWIGQMDFYGSRTVDLPMNRPWVIWPAFTIATRVSVTTDPPGLAFVADGGVMRDGSVLFWTPGTEHNLAPVTPQLQPGTAEWWIFDAWGDGGPAVRTYTVPQAVSVDLSLRYLPGAIANFTTSPPGLALVIDGRSNWPSYNFRWGLGSSHTISAPPTQRGSDGRQYVFREWSVGGPAEQQYYVPPTGAQPGAVVAFYDVLGQLRLESSQPGVEFGVDGEPCAAPCVIDRPAGTEVTITAPVSLPLDAGTRLDFTGWADDGQAVRTWTAGTDAVTLTANYVLKYQLTAVTDPANGADFDFNPPSADGFYPADTDVTVTIKPKKGYAFKYWDGQLDDPLATSQTVRMASPTTVKAFLAEVPYHAIDSVRNAAAETPQAIVAPGSVIAILGGTLALDTEQGPENPLAQSIGGLVVQVMDRYLPLFSVSPKEITAQLPSDLAAGEYTLTVQRDPTEDISAKFTVKRNAPGLFTAPVGDKPYARAFHADGTPVTVDKPAQRNEIITIHGTGFGPYKLQAPDGFQLPEGYDLSVVDAVDIRVGDDVNFTVVKPESVKAVVGMIGVAAVRLKIVDPLPAAATIQVRAAMKDTSDPEGKKYIESNKVLLTLK